MLGQNVTTDKGGSDIGERENNREEDSHEQDTATEEEAVGGIGDIVEHRAVNQSLDDSGDLTSPERPLITPALLALLDNRCLELSSKGRALRKALEGPLGLDDGGKLARLSGLGLTRSLVGEHLVDLCAHASGNVRLGVDLGELGRGRGDSVLHAVGDLTLVERSDGSQVVGCVGAVHVDEAEVLKVGAGLGARTEEDDTALGDDADLVKLFVDTVSSLVQRNDVDPVVDV